MSIHPTAIVDPDAKLGANVTVGPGAIIGPRCVIGDGCVISSHAVIERNVTLGKDVRIGVGAVIGGDPQDLKWQGEDTTVEVGDRTVLREYVTVSRGTSHSWKTVIGKDCFVMAYTHVAHDCVLGDGIIISNGTQIAGHVTIEDGVTISGLCAIHQFVKIGRQSFVGGCAKVTKDIPPFVKAVGNPAKLYGLNSIGLQRSGMPDETLSELKRAYRLFFNADLNLTQAMARAREELAPLPDVTHFLSFLDQSSRGVAT